MGRQRNIILLKYIFYCVGVRTYEAGFEMFVCLFDCFRRDLS